MTVGALLQAVERMLPAAERPQTSAAAGRALDVEVRGVTHDSRQAGPGWVFVALRGLKADGTAFVPQAIAQGAAAVVTDAGPDSVPGDDVPRVLVKDARLALALLAAEFHGHPSRRMQVVGITGTNGKTTTSYLLSAMFEAAGMRTGLMGTVAYRTGTRQVDATRTTPEAPELQAMLRQMADEGCTACAMEVSSHALALRRVDGTRFAAAVFTNLTRDHLDFHADMEDYFAAKRRLFEMLTERAPAVVNLDDPRGALLAETLLAESSVRPITYAINRVADVSPGPLAYSLAGLRFDARTPHGVVRVRSRLVGRPNVYNILAATAAASALGVPLDAIERGVGDLAGVPGRFELASTPDDDITVLVDYAHTDDALRNLLETARPLAEHRLITVFGCGGDRDRSKRPLMGMVAARLSDVVVITSDNPRGEDPARIIDEVRRGAQPELRSGETELLAIVDRRQAIAEAVKRAQPGDVVLVAGKGHEKYQEIGGTVLPFDDVAVARDALAGRVKSKVG